MPPTTALAIAAIAATLVSIAASQILLGAAFASCLWATRGRLRLPPFWPLAALFIAGTLISLLASANPAGGMPQVRKLYLFLMIAVAATALRTAADLRRLFILCGAAGTASALWSFVEFWQRWSAARQLGRAFYAFYVGDRISGFMSHWMTFGGQMSIAALLLAAVLLFAPPQRRWLVWTGWTSVAVMLAALVLAFTRGMWFAFAAGALYLLARWRPKLLLLAPVAAVLVFAVAPRPVQDRITSIYRPHGEVDSNLHRMVTWRTGLQMIAAHPWVGVGPEQVARQFPSYVPGDVPRPLPEGWYGHLHNVYLQYAAERGLPVLLLFLGLAGTVLWHGLRTAARAPVVHGAVAALLAVMVGGVFEFNLGDSEVLTLFLALLACVYVPGEPERA